MSDLDVMFGTNAGEVASQIDRGAAATQRAEGAAARLTKTILAQTQAMKGATTGLKELTSATDKYRSSATGAVDVERKVADQRLKGIQGEAAMAARRRTLLLSVAKQGLADADLLPKQAEAKMGGMFKRLGSLAGSTGTMIGKGLGISGGLGATLLVGYAAVKWLQVYNDHLERNKDLAKEVAEAHLLVARNIKSAREAGQGIGAGAADSQGAGITDLVSRGGRGLDVANALTKQGFRATEAQGATIEAQKKFGEGYEAALSIAARAANAGGGSLSEGLANLDRGELSNPALASARLLAAHRGQDKFSVEELQASEGRLAGNKTTVALGRRAEIQGQTDLAAQDKIPLSVQDSWEKLRATMDPMSKLLADQNATAGEQLTVLKAIRDQQTGLFANFMDQLRNGKDSAASQYARAVNADGGGAAP